MEMKRVLFLVCVCVLTLPGVSCNANLPAPTLAPTAAPMQPTAIRISPESILAETPTPPSAGITVNAPTRVLTLETPLAVPTDVPVEQTALPISTPVLAPETPELGKQITMTGWFVIVYNGGPHYSVTEADGAKAVLEISETAAAEWGGVRQFDRQRVTVQGKVVIQNPLTIQVTHIQLAP
jgi:hypothetical protein